MAAYNYDEGGVMATYFFLTVLALVLIPLTLSSIGGDGAGTFLSFLILSLVLILDCSCNQAGM